MSARSIRRAREREIERQERRRSRLGRKAALAAGAAAGTTVLFAPGAEAATFQVNSLADPGDGTCDTTECTLREAINDANVAAAQADQITFASGLTGTIVIDSGAGQIAIADSLNVQGPGAAQLTVHGDYNSRIFYVADASTDTVSISGLTLRAGSAKYGPNDSNGGAIYSAGGSGQLNVSDSTFTNNQALYADTSGPPFTTYGGGGAIAAYGSAGLTIANSKFNENSSGKYGGAIRAGGTETTITGSTISGNDVVPQKYFGGYFGYGAGGGVSTEGATLAIDGTTITGNSGENGGGVAVKYTDSAAPTGVSITNSVFEHNIGRASGGGVSIVDASSPTRIESSAFTDNVALGSGGGIRVKYGDETAPVSSLTVVGNTLTDNTAGGSGGGMRIEEPVDPVTVRNNSVSDNFASGDGGGISATDNRFAGEVTIDANTISGNEASDGGGLELYGDNPITVQNTTVSGNTAREIGGGVFAGYFNNDASDSPPTSGELSLTNSTISGNTAEGDTPQDGSGSGGGVYVESSEGDTNISSTIISDSGAGDDLATYNGSSPGPGTVNIGFSLIENPGASLFTTTPGGSNITGTDPALGPLADNGGPTETQLPGQASPALDAGVANSLATDQRGQPRTVDQPSIANRTGSDGTDIGAVEVAELEIGTCQGDAVTPKNGTAGDDVLVGTGVVDLIRGGDGDDSARGLAKGDCLFGEDGEDHLSGDTGPDKLDGGAGKDNVKGGGGDDKITGRAGKDTVAAGGGADTVKGNGGKDKLRGAEGGDQIKGGSGSDRLKGAGGDDRISGGGGKDRINCGSGDDVAIADPGDTVSANCETVK